MQVLDALPMLEIVKHIKSRSCYRQRLEDGWKWSNGSSMIIESAKNWDSERRWVASDWAFLLTIGLSANPEPEWLARWRADLQRGCHLWGASLVSPVAAALACGSKDLLHTVLASGAHLRLDLRAANCAWQVILCLNIVCSF